MAARRPDTGLRHGCHGDDPLLEWDDLEVHSAGEAWLTFLARRPG
jgi:hypothetical protein